MRNHCFVNEWNENTICESLGCKYYGTGECRRKFQCLESQPCSSLFMLLLSPSLHRALLPFIHSLLPSRHHLVLIYCCSDYGVRCELEKLLSRSSHKEREFCIILHPPASSYSSQCHSARVSTPFELSSGLFHCNLKKKDLCFGIYRKIKYLNLVVFFGFYVK